MGYNLSGHSLSPFCCGFKGGIAGEKSIIDEHLYFNPLCR